MVSRANTPRGGTKPYLDPLARHNQPHAADGKPRHQKLKHGPNKRKNRRRRLPKVPSGGLDLLPPLIQLRRQRPKPRTTGGRREQLRPPRLYKLHARPHHRREPRRASRPACARRSRWEEGQPPQNGSKCTRKTYPATVPAPRYKSFPASGCTENTLPPAGSASECSPQPGAPTAAFARAGEWIRGRQMLAHGHKRGTYMPPVRLAVN